MSKEKRNIATKLETESKYLTNILDEDDVKEFKKLIPELQDTWRKKQMFRTETEMRFSVLSDNKYPTKAAKYWQSVREQNTHFENLVHLSFESRKNDVKIKKLERDIEQEKIFCYLVIFLVFLASNDNVFSLSPFSKASNCPNTLNTSGCVVPGVIVSFCL